MKKSILLLGASLCVGSLMAQQVPQISADRNVAIPNNKVALTGFEAIPYSQPIKPSGQVSQKSISEEVIMETFYDLQSNSSVQNRSLYHSDGTYGAVMTWSDEANSTFSDRGTGYNYHDGNDFDALPSSRIESTRCGWPSLITTGNGKEVVISHAGSGPFVMNSRATKGSGAWTETTISTNTGQWLLWPRATVGGANNNTIHVIGITAPVTNGGVNYNGLDGALLYWRSTDEGATWDIVDLQLPGCDSSKYNNFRADAYTVVADGDNVAVVSFSQWGDASMWKSTDNGNTWTETIMNDFPLDNYVVDQGSDVDGNGTYDTITTTDEAGAAMIDQNGMVHAFWGEMRVLDADLSDANTSYFPGTNGLRYWNESLGTGGAVIIAGAEDVDGDGVLGFSQAIPLYYVSLSGFPSCTQGPNGTMYVSYSAHMETHENGNQNYRHIYIGKSNDGGATWHSFTDVTPDENYDGLEHVFASMAPLVDNKLRFVYMRDWEPGLTVRGDMDATGVNEIIHLCVDTLLGPTLNVNELAENGNGFELFPNPAQEKTTLVYNMEAAGSVRIRVIDMIGNEVAVLENRTTGAGEQRAFIDLAELSAGAYFVTLEQADKQITQKLVVTR